MKLSAVIMAHPKREHMVAALQHKLGNPPVVYDEKNDRWDTGRRSLLAHLDTGSDYALTIQDDAVIPPKFITGLRNALERVPDGSPLVLYTTRTRSWGPVLDQVPHTVSYLVMDRIWWGVGVVVPTRLIENIVAYGDGCTNPQYDHRLGSYFESEHVPVYYTWPNLCDHADVPSLIPGRSSRRRAQNYARMRADRLRWHGTIQKVDPPADIETPAR